MTVRFATQRGRDASELESSLTADGAVMVLREVIVALVRRDGPMLSSHQLGVFLTCYLKDGHHTVRGLAADLNVSKSVITRALDKLGDLDLARRRVDPSDRRSVIVERTEDGQGLLETMRILAVQAAKSLAVDEPPKGQVDT